MTADGELFTWGMGMDGQMGFSPPVMHNATPQHVPLGNNKVIQVRLIPMLHLLTTTFYRSAAVLGILVLLLRMDEYSCGAGAGMGSWDKVGVIPPSL